MAGALSAPIPQEIIDEIINYIRDDLTTLKDCSLTSHAFYEPTRKYLFATATLGQPDAVTSLSRILERNPRLSRHIRSLKIRSLDEITLGEIVAILPALTQTRHLVLGIYHFVRSFAISSPQVLNLLAAVLRLPLLDTLEILSIIEFPISHLLIARGLKSLTLMSCQIHRTNITEAVSRPLTQLESIHFERVWRREYMTDTSPILDAPNLRQVIIRTPMANMQPILQAGAKSIETLIWVGFLHGRRYSAVDLRVLRNLRRLCFILREGDEREPSATTTWDSIDAMLHDGEFAHCLEELSFAIEQDDETVPTLGFVGLGSIWTRLPDSIQLPNLKKVFIHLVHKANNQGPAPTAGEFQSLMSQKLPLLAEAGLLRTSVCDKFEWQDFL